MESQPPVTLGEQSLVGKATVVVEDAAAAGDNEIRGPMAEGSLQRIASTSWSCAVCSGVPEITLSDAAGQRARSCARSTLRIASSPGFAYP